MGGGRVGKKPKTIRAKKKGKKKNHAEGRSNCDFYLIYKIYQSAYWGKKWELQLFISPQIGLFFTKHDSPQASAGPAVGGIIGLALVEHVILWTTVKPKRRLALLIGCFFALFVVGTFPQVNNFSLIAGSLYGFLFALLLWSSVVFKHNVILFQLLLVFVIVAMFLFSIVLFMRFNTFTFVHSIVI